MRSLILALGLGLSTALGAAAEPVDEDTARKALFGTRGYDVQFPVKELGIPGAAEYAERLVDSFETRLSAANVKFNYYSAIALPRALLSLPESQRGPAIEAGQAGIALAANSPQGAAALAAAMCNAAASDCVVVALFVPRRFKAQPVYLSIPATEAFKDYRRLDGPKAFAASPTTSAFGMASGGSAQSQALAICGEKGARDCEIVILD